MSVTPKQFYAHALRVASRSRRRRPSRRKLKFDQDSDSGPYWEGSRDRPSLTDCLSYDERPERSSWSRPPRRRPNKHRSLVKGPSRPRSPSVGGLKSNGRPVSIVYPHGLAERQIALILGQRGGPGFYSTPIVGNSARYHWAARKRLFIEQYEDRPRRTTLFSLSSRRKRAEQLNTRNCWIFRCGRVYAQFENSMWRAI